MIHTVPHLETKVIKTKPAIALRVHSLEADPLQNRLKTMETKVLDRLPQTATPTLQQAIGSPIAAPHHRTSHKPLWVAHRCPKRNPHLQNRPTAYPCKVALILRAPNPTGRLRIDQFQLQTATYDALRLQLIHHAQTPWKVHVRIGILRHDRVMGLEIPIRLRVPPPMIKVP